MLREQAFYRFQFDQDQAVHQQIGYKLSNDYTAKPDSQTDLRSNIEPFSPRAINKDFS